MGPLAKKYVSDVSGKAADAVSEQSLKSIHTLLEAPPSDNTPAPKTEPVAQEDPAAHAAAARAAFYGTPVPNDTDTGTSDSPDGVPEAEPPVETPREKVSVVRSSVLPGFGSPGIKLLQVLLGGVLLGFGLFFQFADTDIGGASFMSIAFLVVAFLILSYEVISDGLRKLFRGKFLDSDLLMTVATLGGMFVGQFPAACVAMFLYVLAGFFTSLNASRSDALFGALEDFEVEEVYVAREGKFVAVPPEKVWPGETILVRQNELIPMDGVVAGGSGRLDTVLLSGESAPRYVFAGDRVSSGMVVTSEELQVVTTASYKDSTAQRIADFLYDDTAEESREGDFAKKFSTAFGIVVIILGLALGIVPSILTGNWSEWMRIAFTFLVVAGTSELLVQGPLLFENGLGTAFYNGVCVKGDGPFEQLAHAEKVVFNKTGTLTRGEPDVIDIIPAEGYRSDQLLEVAAKAEALSNHRIADSILKAYGKPVDMEALTGFKEVPGEGVSVYVNGHRLVAGNARCMLAEGIDVRESHQAGNKLHVSADGKYLGCVVTADTPRRDAAETVSGLHDLGLTGVTMLTGGTRSTSKLLAEELAVDEFGAELGPKDKLAALQTFAKNLSSDGTLVFVGDGLKDVSLISYADAGVAMGAFRSAEVFSHADAVILPESPSRLVKAIQTARKTFSYARANTVLTILLKAAVMVLAVVGLVGIWAGPVVTLVSSVLTFLFCRNLRAGWTKEKKKKSKE